MSELITMKKKQTVDEWRMLPVGFSTEPSRMYAAMRAIEQELAQPKPSIKRIREIMKAAGQKLRGAT